MTVLTSLIFSLRNSTDQNHLKHFPCEIYGWAILHLHQLLRQIFCKESVYGIWKNTHFEKIVEGDTLTYLRTLLEKVTDGENNAAIILSSEDENGMMVKW